MTAFAFRSAAAAAATAANDSESSANSVVPEAVTLIVTRRVAPGRHRDSQAWLRHGTLLAAGFPGFLGAGVLAPSGASDKFQVIMRFETPDSLDKWERSLPRRMWLERGEALMQSSELQRVHGMDMIFGKLPVDASGPARWQRAIFVWMFLFPIALCLNSLLFRLVPGLPVPFRVLATTMVQVPMMIYVGAPLINYLWRKRHRPAVRAG